MKEYIFSSPAGYRKFYVMADNEEQAKKRFQLASEAGETNGFTLDDLPVIYEKELVQMK